MPYLNKIFLYPIKSLDGVEVDTAKILPSGALQCDREFAIFDEQGKVVNGKRHVKIHLLRSEFSLKHRLVSFRIPNSNSTQYLHLDEERQLIEEILSDFLGFAVTLQQNSLTGFPDDTKSPGSTVISTPTLAQVASWYPDLSVNEIRCRIRANLEIEDVPPFWEDRLFAEDGNTVSFQIGDVHFFGVNPCQRCVIPSRDSHSGQTYPNFQKIFVNQRQASLPEWVRVSRFNHFYYLSVNTRLPTSAAGKTLQVGDEIKILP